MIVLDEGEDKHIKMPDFGVRPEKEKALAERMIRIGIRETDICEKFIRSGGKGGQNRNKTSTCVYLKHIPSGIEVKVEKERQQNINRFLARRLLADKYEHEVLGFKIRKDLEIERRKKQKKRRERKLKRKLLLRDESDDKKRDDSAGA